MREILYDIKFQTLFALSLLPLSPSLAQTIEGQERREELCAWRLIKIGQLRNIPRAVSCISTTGFSRRGREIRT
jgi:hypothetical protein